MESSSTVAGSTSKAKLVLATAVSPLLVGITAHTPLSTACAGVAWSVTTRPSTVSPSIAAPSTTISSALVAVARRDEPRMISPVGREAGKRSAAMGVVWNLLETGGGDAAAPHHPRGDGSVSCP
jgi:hypothetical protein